MDSGNIVDKNEELEQPVDAVVADAEENGSPQAVDSDSELFVETEDDQQQTSNSGMSKRNLTAAFLEERQKRKKKTKELQKEREEKQRLDNELAELRAQVSSVTNPKPNPSDFYNAEDYDTALSSWQQASKPVEKKQEAQLQNVGVDDQTAYELFSSEEQVKKSLPDYEDAKAAVTDVFIQEGVTPENTELVFANINGLSKFTGSDPAKAIYAFSKNPLLMRKFLQASGANDNGLAMSNVIKEAASKVKSRNKVAIDSQPEPDIKSSGPVDNSTAAINKAREAWQKADAGKKIAAWNKYQGLKKQNKVNENGK